MFTEIPAAAAPALDAMVLAAAEMQRKDVRRLAAHGLADALEWWAQAFVGALEEEAEAEGSHAHLVAEDTADRVWLESVAPRLSAVRGSMRGPIEAAIFEFRHAAIAAVAA